MKKSLVKKLERMREQLADMREFLDDLSSEYQDKLNNATEKWLASDAGEDCATVHELLQQAAADVEGAESAIQDVVSS